jgi:hypothetical protein
MSLGIGTTTVNTTITIVIPTGIEYAGYFLDQIGEHI